MAPQNDFFRDIRLALSLLTRLPLRIDEKSYEHSAAAAWAYPLVGLFTGIFACIAVQAALWMGLPLWTAAIFALSAGIIVTGAMHEDGMADCADGFWGGWDPAMRLKIMKDSQIGTYGLLALLVTVSLRFGATLEVLRWDDWVLPLIAVHIASRSVMPAVMHALPHARDTGLSRSVGNVSQKNALISASIGAVALVITFGFSGIMFSLIAAVAAFLASRLALAKIGGQTGDVCGATQQITEVTLLLVFLAG